VWVSEHYFRSAAPSSVAAALAATRRIPVGTGIVSALARRPAVFALELATLVRRHPGRVRGGIEVASSSSCASSVSSRARRSRRCASASSAFGGCWRAKADGDVRLALPAAKPVPLNLGVVGARLLELSARVRTGLSCRG
jgi:5,10-methylenetetrahydromethanopterin reductase